MYKILRDITLIFLPGTRTQVTSAAKTPAGTPGTRTPGISGAKTLGTPGTPGAKTPGTPGTNRVSFPNIFGTYSYLRFGNGKSHFRLDKEIE